MATHTTPTRAVLTLAVGVMLATSLVACGGGSERSADAYCKAFYEAGLTSSGSLTRVDSYLQQHCPVDSELAQNIIDESR